MARVTFGKTARHTFDQIGNFRTTNKRRFIRKKERKKERKISIIKNKSNKDK